MYLQQNPDFILFLGWAHKGAACLHAVHNSQCYQSWWNKGLYHLENSYCFSKSFWRKIYNYDVQSYNLLEELHLKGQGHEIWFGEKWYHWKDLDE